MSKQGIGKRPPWRRVLVFGCTAKKYLRNVYIMQIHHGIFLDVRGAEFLCGALFDNTHIHVGLSTLSLQAEKPDLDRVSDVCDLPNAWIAGL